MGLQHALKEDHRGVLVRNVIGEVADADLLAEAVRAGAADSAGFRGEGPADGM